MSDNNHQPAGSSKTIGEVQHVQNLSEDIGALFLNDEYSDVTLIVENQSFRGHKVILAARSDYFRALLFGGMRESLQSQIELQEASLAAFEVLLKYIYTGQMSLTNLQEDTILEILSMAHKYVFTELENAISEYLKAVLNAGNVCNIYDMANLYQLDSLVKVCSMFMDNHALEIIHQESFLSLSPYALKELIIRDSFCVTEVELFKAVWSWTKQNPDCDSQEVLQAIRLPLMTQEDLLNVVRPTGLVTSDNILDAIAARLGSRDAGLKYRGRLVAEENVASNKHNAAVIQGEMRPTLLDGDVQNYDMERGFTRHPLDDNNGQGIVIKLGTDYILNHIKLLLWDKDTRSYSYYVEVSVDGKDWFRIIDHAKYLCRSWQHLYFDPRVARFIRIVGTHNTVNRVFHLVCVEAMYTDHPLQVEQGFVVPKDYVSTISANACVIEGVSRNRNALLNGDNKKNYDWDSGYTCHQLGSGSIVIQLAQLFLLDSMRLLLWDCDDRSYSYYIEVSNDHNKWDLLIDKTSEACRSWQTLRFRKRVVVFIRITGTKNTANEVFHCVHFECPAKSDGEEASKGNGQVSGSQTLPT